MITAIMAGCVTYLVPHYCFAYVLLREPWARKARITMKRMYYAEVMKLLSIAVAASIWVILFSLPLLPLLLGIVIGQVGFYFIIFLLSFCKRRWVFL
jgi:F0F1-type ATP synthase assembly protein I